MPKIFDKTRRFYATFGRPTKNGFITCHIYFVRDNGESERTEAKSVFMNYTNAKKWAVSTMERKGRELPSWIKPRSKFARIIQLAPKERDTPTKYQNKMKMNARLETLRRGGWKRG